jgi:2'-hydroxyisoflavone reductase
LTTRRDFMKHAAVAGGAIGLGLGVPAGGEAAASAGSLLATSPYGGRVERAARSLRLLILGGTGFTGPFQVAYAVARGHQVTVFNRGRRQTELPASVEQLQGDRAEGDLRALEGRTWDVVIDNPTTLPFWVRDAGQLLAGRTNQYIFISTISVYDSNATPGADETAPTHGYDGDPLEVRQATNQLYGPMKAASEREAERWFPGRTTIIRPGLIVGPRDESDRFSYWPIRIARGGEVLAPGQPTDPVQLIDARDLAEWTIRMAENGTTGVFNATGPRSRLSIAEMLGGIRAVLPASHEVRLTWVPAEFLAEHGVQPWGHMPVWVPPVGQSAGFADRGISRAVEAGLTFRPLAETARDTLAWHAERPAERQARLNAGLPAEREAEVLSAWRARG